MCVLQPNSDNLLGPSLRKFIEDNLGKTTLNKIEVRLAEKHGIGISQAITEFSKLDDILKEFFGVGSQELESKFIHSTKVMPGKVGALNVLKKLLVSTIRVSIEENLGAPTLNKIEKRLLERYNMNTDQAIEDFPKFQKVLREFFGAGAEGLETRFIQDIAKVDSLAKHFEGLNHNEKISMIKFLESFPEKTGTKKLKSLLAQPMA